MSSSASSSPCGQELDDPVQQVARAQPLGRGDRDRLAQPEAMELGGERYLGHAVALVGRDDRRQRGAAQQVGHLLIARTHAGARVDDEHRHLGIGDPRACLIADRARQRVLVLEVHAARVDQLELAPVPLAVDLVAVARDPRTLVHDRLTAAREPVDQRGLAHVWITDDCDLHRPRLACGAAR